MLTIEPLPVQRGAVSTHSGSLWIQKQLSRLAPLMGGPLFGVGLSLLALVPLLLT